MSKPNDTQPARSPLLPLRLNADDKFQIHCHKGIACFNACCKNMDITLTPCDIVRLKNRLGMSSYEFLATRTTRFDMDAHGVPGVKLGTQKGSSACQFLTKDGCSVYPDRATACRYYALGTVSMRKVREYREVQGVDRYDEVNKEWRQIVLKNALVARPLENLVHSAWISFIFAAMT
jgi:Fe-S-cluster containining protein